MSFQSFSKLNTSDITQHLNHTTYGITDANKQIILIRTSKSYGCEQVTTHRFYASLQCACLHTLDLYSFLLHLDPQQKFVLRNHTIIGGHTISSNRSLK
eukprot:977904_1